MMMSIGAPTASTTAATQMRRPDGHPSPKMMFEKVDENGDGQVDKAEFSAFAQKMQERFGVELDVDKAMQDMDTDGNATLSQDELQAGMEAMRPSSPPPTGRMFGGYGPHGRPVNMNGAAGSSQESLLSLEA